MHNVHTGKFILFFLKFDNIFDVLIYHDLKVEK